MSEYYDLGVLLVHGIGDQQQSSTLSRFAGALQRWLRRSYGVDGRPRANGAEQIALGSMVQVTDVQRRTPDGATPAHANVLVRRPGDARGTSPSSP